MSAPSSTSTRSGVVPELREVAIASSTRSRATRPMSTITSVRKREEEPRRVGEVIPTRPLARRLARPAGRPGMTSGPGACSLALGQRHDHRGLLLHAEDLMQVGAAVRPRSRRPPPVYASPASSPVRRGACLEHGGRPDDRGCRHRLAGPQFEAERALGDEQLQAVERSPLPARARRQAAVFGLRCRRDQRHTSTYRPDRA